MIRASKIIPIVDDNRQFQGINVTVYDNKIRKRIRLETYNGEVRYNLQDIAVMCGLQEIDSVSDYVVAGRDFLLNQANRLRKKTPEKKLVSKDSVIKFLKENQYNYIDFIEEAESVYNLYFEWYLNPDKKISELFFFKERQRKSQERNLEKIKERRRLNAKKYYNTHKNEEKFKERKRQANKKYIENNFKKFTIKNRLKAKKYLEIHKDDEEFKERKRQATKKYRENNLERYREKCRISEKKYREKEEVREHYKQYQKEYWIKHREELKEKNRLYRLKKKQEKEA